MHGKEAILFNNDAFYPAFSCRDIEAMPYLWVQTNDVSVIHPGWRAFVRSGGGFSAAGLVSFLREIFRQLTAENLTWSSGMIALP